MPQRSTDKVRPERTRSLQCQHCQRVRMYTGVNSEVDHGNLPYIRERFFHDTCTTCPPREPSREPLCSFCNHLQLPHIFGCITPKDEYLSSLSLITGFSTTWGKGYTGLLEDQACPLCAVIGSTLRKRTAKMDQNGGKVFNDSVSVYFLRMRDESGKLGSWELSIELDSFRMPSTLICIGEMKVAKDGSGNAAYPEPLFGPDWELVRQWIWKCHQDHHSRKIPIDTTDKDFKLIDVRNNCLISASKACSYAALSYVWGDLGAGEAQAVLANVSRLQQKGGLLLHELPQCILDALTACKNFGVHFLWVDRFCIVQDDAHSKHGQIKQMGSIYASAIVTIVAAAGENARHGLVGVSRLSASAQLRQKLALHGIEFTEILQTDYCSESIQQSVWRSRGWTFQEEKMSTALLLFSECGVSFQCKHRPGRMEMEGFTKASLWIDSNASYPYVVSEYSQRKLSFGSDILDAFSGYLAMEFKDEHYFGLPCAYFTQALLWKSVGNSGLPRKSNGNEPFPSWSWASTTGAVNYHSWLNWGYYEPIASWAAIMFPPGRSPQSFPACEVPCTLPSLTELLESDEIWTYWQKKPAWRRFLFKQHLLTLVLYEELSQFWTTVQRLVKSYMGIWFQSKWLSMKHNLSTDVITGLEPREVFPAGRLMAYTQIAKVSVTRLLWPASFALRRNPPFILRNERGKWIGFVNLDKPTAELGLGSYYLRGETYSAECLAISLHRENDCKVPLLLDEDLDTMQDRAEKPGDDHKSQGRFQKRSHRFWREMGCLEHQVSEAKRQSSPFRFSRVDEPHSGYPPQLTVMMVERTEGVARRVGLGNVYLKRWRESAPSFQSVVLD